MENFAGSRTFSFFGGWSSSELVVPSDALRSRCWVSQPRSPQVALSFLRALSLERVITERSQPRWRSADMCGFSRTCRPWCWVWYRGERPPMSHSRRSRGAALRAVQQLPSVCSGSTGDITGWRSGRSASRCAGSGNYLPPATALNLDGLAYVSDCIVSWWPRTLRWRRLLKALGWRSRSIRSCRSQKT